MVGSLDSSDNENNMSASPYGESPHAFGSPFGRSQSSQDDEEMVQDESAVDYENEDAEHYGYPENEGEEMFLMDEEVS